MPRSFRWKIPLLVVVLAFACLQTFPLAEKINLGLDLQGGMHLVLRVDTSELPPTAKVEDVTEVALEVIRNRIDQFGVREPTLQRQGERRIIIQLPGVQDPARAKALIGKTALLEFNMVEENANPVEAEERGAPEGLKLLYEIERDRESVQVTISLGVASYPLDHVDSAEGMLEAADKRLYEAKGAGRNQTVFE